MDDSTNIMEGPTLSNGETPSSNTTERKNSSPRGTKRAASLAKDGLSKGVKTAKSQLSSNAASTSSIVQAGQKKKRAPMNPCKLSDADELTMLEFIQENPMIWNIKLIDFKRRDKKEKLWEFISNQLDKTPEHLKIWFKSLRDTFVRLDKRKSGDAPHELTERETWIMNNFVFLKRIIRHRPKPMQSCVRKKKRAPMNLCKLSDADELTMLEFIQENPMIWNIKLSDFKRRDKKEKLWEFISNQLDKTPEHLKIWFKSLRDTFVRLDKRKSGDAPHELTERETWIMNNFVFLKRITRHRPEPMQSCVRETITQHRGDLDAAESACADLQMDSNDGTQPVNPSSSRKQLYEQPSSESLRNGLTESTDLIRSFTASQQQPLTVRSTFANYVRDSLMIMSEEQFMKSRARINQLLSEHISEDLNSYTNG